MATNPIAAPDDSAAATAPTELISAALKGDLVGIFQREVPALAGLGREAAYEAVMNDPELLDSCFRLFRQKPELFATLVVDADRNPVTADGVGLWCGRTLGEAISLVVRASARRYFRRKLGATKRVPAKPKHVPGLLERLGISLGLVAAKPPIMCKVVGPGDRLFGLIRENLHFDWQAALIPHYAPLAPEMVVQLGPRLLDIREPSELRALSSREERASLADGRPPLLMDNAKRLIKATGDTIDSELLYKVCNQMDLARLFPDRDANAMRRAIAQVAGTSAAAIEKIMPVLGGDIRLFVCFFFVAYVTLGEEEYRQCFLATGASQRFVQRFADRLAQLGELPPPALDAIRETFTSVLSVQK